MREAGECGIEKSFIQSNPRVWFHNIVCEHSVAICVERRTVLCYAVSCGQSAFISLSRQMEELKVCNPGIEGNMIPVVLWQRSTECSGRMWCK